MTAIERPSDEVVGKVIQAQLDLPPFVMTTDIESQAIISVTTIGGMTIDVKDPRDDTNAALDLLGWINTHHDILITMGTFPNREVRWLLEDDSHECKYKWLFDEGYDTLRSGIPISGPPFRYAVINLAVKVMEINM